MAEQVKEYDAIVVGAGFSGIYMLLRLKRQGLRVRVFEEGGGVGGTWYWNRYPGARCDIPSMEYSYQFSDALQQEWNWTERYATQPEILGYAEHVVERFDLAGDIQFDTRVESARYDEVAMLWQVGLKGGERASARYLIMATGCLSRPNRPNIPGLEDYAGRLLHTGLWPHEPVSFAGERVGIIGTGSSAIQAIPLIADQADALWVFQRTPNYSVPARNAPLSEDYVADIKSRYAEYRAANWQNAAGADFNAREELATEATEDELQREYEARWQRGGLAFLSAYADLIVDPAANATARQFVAGKIGEIVGDSELADSLTPTTLIGCKRLCVDTDYYRTYNEDHVRLVDLQLDPIECILADGVRTKKETFVLDSLILATGFDAMTGALLHIDICGLKGQRLCDKWAHGPKTYLGLATSGFPNLFTVTGPGSPSVLSNMLPSIEQHVDWIADCIAWMGRHNHASIEADGAAEDAWVEHVNEVADATIFPGCNSWYMGANVEGKPRVFMPYIGVPPYVARCREVAAADYEGFRFR